MEAINADVIYTPADRTTHIETCKANDLQSPLGMVPNDNYYETLGNQASVNSWYYHDDPCGFNRLYANTPNWIVELAHNMGWIYDKGERTRCAM